VEHSLNPGPSRCCPCGASVPPAPRSFDRDNRPCIGRPNVLCGHHHREVVRHVTRRFGSHRYGGRLVDRIPDVVQDCYRKQLLRDGVLDSFRPPLDEDLRAPLCSAWLWKIVHNVCNNAAKSFSREKRYQCLGPIEPVSMALPVEGLLTAEFLMSVHREAMNTVREKWKERNELDEFVLLEPLLFECDIPHAAVANVLGVTVGHLNVKLTRLRKEVRRIERKAIVDNLHLGPNADVATEERAFRRELAESFRVLEVFRDDEPTVPLVARESKGKEQSSPPPAETHPFGREAPSGMRSIPLEIGSGNENKGGGRR
jgi:DNA-directed RNA polymerase specialized sigma24 family protein